MGHLGVVLGHLGAVLAALAPLLGCSWLLLGDLGASGGDFGSFGGRFEVDLGSIWINLGRFESIFYFFDLFWRSCEEMCYKCPKGFFQEQNIERRPWEGLRSYLPLSALPVLAQTGLS